MSRLAWTRSRLCLDGQCIEFARDEEMVLVRESEEPHALLHLTEGEADGFIRGIERGERLGEIGDCVTIEQNDDGVALSTCSAEIRTSAVNFNAFIAGVLAGDFDQYKLTTKLTT